VIILTDQTEDFELLNNHYEIFVDTSCKAGIADVSTLYQSKFFFSKSSYNFVEDPGSVYWLRFKIKDQSDQKKKWVLEYFSVHTQHLDLFMQDGRGGFEKKSIGQLLPFFIRDYHVSNFVFDLPRDLSGEEYIYARIFSRHPSGFEFKIRSQQYFTSYAVYEYYFLGIYYGILLIMAVYNLLLFFSSREKVYLYYVLYVASCIINSFAEDGLGFQFLWPYFPHWNWAINNFIGSSLLLLSFMFYSTSFLDLKKNFSPFLKPLLYSTLVYFIYTIFEMAFQFFLNFSFLYLVPFAIVYIASVYHYRKNYKPARYFILGYSFVFLSIVIIQLRNYNLVPHNIFTVYSFNYGILLEVVALSFALGDRIRLMKLEKENARKVLIAQLEENQRLQQKVNRELEQKVNDRTTMLVQKTSELEEANAKLKKLTEELNKFASKLDHDNWELNKKVIEEKKARMNAEVLTYEEFVKIFPNDFTCLKYLEELKWGENYKCKKCGNARFAVKQKLLSRKCSKCNYIESVTSSTIFHALKFPIQKAFYIAYITSVKKDNITVDKLASLLTLNRLTCYKFRKKVMDREAEAIQKSKSAKLPGWEKLILDKN
jgi:hypothetical protein